MHVYDSVQIRVGGIRRTFAWQCTDQRRQGQIPSECIDFSYTYRSGWGQNALILATHITVECIDCS